MIALLFALNTLIQHHITVGDYQSGIKAAEILVEQSPEFDNWTIFLQALARGGEIEKMGEVWQKVEEKFGEAAFENSLLEEMAWGIIGDGASSPSPYLRTLSCIAAFCGQDVEGVKILAVLLKDTNPIVRSVACEFSGNFQDQVLKKGLKEIVLKDPDWKVRISAIASLAKMEEKVFLMELLQNGSVCNEERMVAVEGLLDQVTKEELEPLVKSQRPELRYLAACVIGENHLQEKEETLFFLAQDHHPQVRAQAIKSLGMMRSQNQTVLLKSCSDIDPYVQIASAWSFVFIDQNQAWQIFEKLLSHPIKGIRAEAAAALAATGKGGEGLMQKALDQFGDPFVQINLASGLLGMRHCTEKGCRALLDMPQEKLMWSTNLFRTVVPSQRRHEPLIANLPEAEDEMVRLELLSLLALMEHPDAENRIVAFLDKTHWGLTAISSAILLTEGKSYQAEGVRKLLKHPNHKVRIQTALILALWGEDQEAKEVLLQEYPKACREIKERILEGFAKMASSDLVPFLARQICQGPQSLRILAAAALLQALYG